MMVIDNEFELGELVYLKTDNDQVKRIVTGICMGMNGITYCLSCGVVNTWHYVAEMSREKDVLIGTVN